MDEDTIREALNRHWAASDANDFEVEHDIYREDAVLEYPQSGERIGDDATSRRLALHSRISSASRCAELSAREISGSRNSSLRMTASHPIR